MSGGADLDRRDQSLLDDLVGKVYRMTFGKHKGEHAILKCYCKLFSLHVINTRIVQSYDISTLKELEDVSIYVAEDVFELKDKHG